MKPTNVAGRFLVAPFFAALVAGFILVPQNLEGQDGQAGDPQILTRGPIHEAFAEPIKFDPVPGMTVNRQPPPLVEEIPPDQKPDGDNVAWIPGYWQWEDDRKDFIWVSGFWRVLPPGRKWVPGYWYQGENGAAPAQYQWVGGYWADADEGQVEYLPAPPATLENGAPTEPPTENHVWTPGSWVYRETRYLWRPGFWVVAQPGWIWTPACFVWTPCGYVFRDGYWDYVVVRRGVIFAPCYWSAWHFRPRYVYRPTICIDGAIITDHFFCRTGFRGYYFGDYYGGTYVGLGFTPWFRFHYARGGGYCPVFAYNAWYHRATPNWRINLQVGYDNCFRHVNARPPRTFIAQQNIIRNVNVNQTIINNNVTVINQDNRRIDASRRIVAKPITQIANESSASRDAAMRFRRIEPTEVKRFQDQGREVQQLGSRRLDLERQATRQLAARDDGRRPGAAGGRPGGAGSGPGAGGRPGGAAAGGAAAQPIKIDLPSSPVVDRRRPARPSAGEGEAGKGSEAASDRQPPAVPGQGRVRPGAGGAIAQPTRPGAGDLAERPGLRPGMRPGASGPSGEGQRIVPSRPGGRPSDAGESSGQPGLRPGIRPGASGEGQRIVPSRPDGRSGGAGESSGQPGQRPGIRPGTPGGSSGEGQRIVPSRPDGRSGGAGESSGQPGQRPGIRPGTPGGSSGEGQRIVPSRPGNQPPSGGSGSAGSGGNRPPSGGGNRPPSGGSGTAGSGGNRPPSGGSGSAGSGGNRPPSGGGNRPPSGGSGTAGSGGNRPPSGGSGSAGSGGNRPPSGGGNRPPSGGGSGGNRDRERPPRGG